MWRYHGYLVAVLIISVLCSCKPTLVEAPDTTFMVINTWISEHKASVTYGLPRQEMAMEQAFRQGYILVYGEGLPKKDATGAGQRRLTAQRAAEVVAQRALAQVLSQGGRYGSIRFDTYSASMTPTVRGFEVVAKEYNNDAGKAAVLLKYDLHGAQRFIH